MFKPTVYLGGPIAFCKDDECVSWRERAKREQGDKFKFLDPLRRDYRGVEIENVEKLVQDDLKDIGNSHALLIGHTRPSTGTAMEIVYAHMAGKPIVVYAEDLSTVSPWIIYHASAVLNDWDMTMDILERLTRAVAQLPLMGYCPDSLEQAFPDSIGSSEIEKEIMFNRLATGRTSADHENKSNPPGGPSDEGNDIVYTQDGDPC
ncbi:MAG: nucleoside 2-deoxyribosyltransferase [Synergistaceae bacterium]